MTERRVERDSDLETKVLILDLGGSKEWVVARRRTKIVSWEPVTHATSTVGCKEMLGTCDFGRVSSDAEE
ncbi:MAG: hypothetical protein M3285_03065 [Actinomycetota bacterium]|nr:hypothetical protein [Actinomycetota bacterium]